MDDLTATDVFKFNIMEARVRYLKAKREQGIILDAQLVVRKMFEAPAHDPFDDSLPMFLRRQAD